MRDIDPRAASSWAPRASVGLTALAVALLTCGAAIEVTGNVLDSAAKGNGGDSHPVRTVAPPHGRSHASKTPAPHPSPSASPTGLPSPSATPSATPPPTATATATGGPVIRW